MESAHESTQIVYKDLQRSMAPQDSPSLAVARNWWASEPVGDGITRFWEPHTHELIQSNAFLVKGSYRDLLIDGGNGLASLRQELDVQGLLDKPVIAVATHSHFDHTGSIHEFEDRRIHELEAAVLAGGGDPVVLCSSDFPDDLHHFLETHGMVLPPVLIDALPHPSFDPLIPTVKPTQATSLLREGDLVDLGDRVFKVLHLPGHSPGQIGLFESSTGILFAADAVYRGILIDEAVPGANIGDYIETMKMLRELPVQTVHGGHESAMTRSELISLVNSYLASRDA